MKRTISYLFILLFIYLSEAINTMISDVSKLSFSDIAEIIYISRENYKDILPTILDRAKKKIDRYA